MKYLTSQKVKILFLSLLKVKLNKIMRSFYFLSLLLGLIYSNGVSAYGDYPLPHCHANGATIIDIDGINTDKAFMKGAITKADLHEYCARMAQEPETKIIKIRQCVEQEYADQKNTKLMATANCSKGTMIVIEGASKLNLKFPDPDLESQGCGAEYQYIVQFKTLCPKMAERLKVKNFDEWRNARR
jgi:hypothetical protein